MDHVICQKNPPGCIIFDNWVFDNLISADKLFAKTYEHWQLVYWLVITHEEN